MTRIAVVGPGGVGIFFAAHLAAVGHDVVSCARRPFDRYEVESDAAPMSGPATAVTDPAEVTGAFDYVFVGVKAHQTAGAADWLAATCTSDTIVVTMQNGAEAVARLEPYVNGALVLEAVVYCGGTLVEPGHTINSGGGTLILPDVDASDAVAELFASSPARVARNPAHLTEKWRKLAINVAVNGVTALTDKYIPVASEGPGREVARSVLTEAFAVGRAEGADLADELVDKMLDGFAEARGGKTSMHQDRSAGRPTEYDALYGAVVRAGERHGIPTPVNAAIGQLLAAGD